MKKEYTASHTLLVGLLLAFAGGYLDIYTYICRGGIFANAETGNMVLMGAYIAQGNVQRALNYVPPILAFALGVIISEVVKNKYGNKGTIHWRQVILGVEIIALIILSFVPSNEVFNLIVNTSISFVCSLQVQTFRKIRGNVLATTMCTGNLRSASEHLHSYIHTKDKTYLQKMFVYLFIIGMFIVGAITGAIFTNMFNIHSILIASVTLIIAFILIFIKGEVDTFL